MKHIEKLDNPRKVKTYTVFKRKKVGVKNF